MWETLKKYTKIILGVAVDADTNIEFAQKKMEERADLNNDYNKEHLAYAKNIRAESNDSKNWDHMRPLNANEAINEAEKALQNDIDRYMMSDDIEQRAFGYKLKMDHYNDLYNAARSQEEKDKIQKVMDLQNQEVAKREKEIRERLNNGSQSNMNDKKSNEKNDDKSDGKNDNKNSEIRAQIKSLEEQIEQLRKQIK